MDAVTVYIQPTYAYELFIRVLHCFLNQAPKMGGDILSRRRNEDELEKGKMPVSEAGRRGGAKGGPRVRELIREGKERENE
jgi:hypothetical protein